MDNSIKTTNGMDAFVSSLNSCVDLFYKIGASRGKNIIPDFEKAIQEDTDIAIRIAQWVRDVRGGSGERQLYRDILVHLANTKVDICRALMVKTPEIGRWDDLLSLAGTPLESDAFALIKYGLLEEKNGLCAKWLPRKGEVAIKLRKFMGMTPKQYRKTLVNLTNVVESKMCAKDWNSIEFDKLPSLAAARYQNAFNKNAPEQYRKYKSGLASGTTTINAGAVYPYDIVKSVRWGDRTVSDAQWNALPNYMEGSSERIIPLVDVSGSMCCSAGGNMNLTCLDVAISLGLYISERNEGIFKDKFITFSTDPQFVSLSGSLSTRIRKMEKSSWAMSTDIEKALDMILNSAKLYSVPQSHMPTKILILSDMQFNCSHRGGNFKATLERKYQNAGYKVPNIIFWNLNAHSNIPVTYDTNGTALVSGFSPSLMKSVLKSEALNPIQIMKESVCIDRYDW